MSEPETQPIPPQGDPIVEHPITAPIGDPAATPAATPERTDNRGPIVAGIVLFLLLAAGEAWLFHAQGTASDQTGTIAALNQQVDSLKSEVATLQSRLETINTKVAGLANRPAPAPPAPQVKVETKIPSALADQIKTMQAGIASLSTTALADHAALATLQTNAADLPKQVAKAQMLAQLAQASLALENGMPLGTIPNAPEALVRYATTAPPTLAGLKASFPGYAQKAAVAGGDVAASGGFWQRVKGRVESMVTIRHNARVLVGSRAAGILGAAQTDLDHNNLTAALTALKPLPQGAAAVMAPWITRANHLVAARTALATMAASPAAGAAGSH
ncbi:hypothetical protein AruPA_09870 [Acidiphilium sp. PA]|uniref:hypothetical protein n=1 Tax=Acidiphilium sp. PA TaxID=2871705 RepID=UPI002243EB68|nr:hypothetical protein [Acidiphilium sp. PA]MCW8307341.1 hypothetical protein [Acidiphilium sp. PA]